MGPGERVPTNLRTLRILEILGAAEYPMTPTQINQQLGLPKQTVHRLCTTLVDEGYLVKVPNQKGLRPARRIRNLSAGLLHGSRFHISRHQLLEDIAKQVSETVNFSVPEEKGMVYKDRVETDWAFRIQLPVGTHVPFHCTASGKTYLSSLGPKAREAAVESLAMEQLTQNTIADPQALLEQLKEVRQAGYALDNEEFIEGMVAIAVPVLDPAGRYCSSIAFHGPRQRLSLDLALSKRNFLIEGAKKMTKVLFA